EGVSAPSGTPQRATGTAGLPCTSVIGATDCVTTLPAGTTGPRPIVTLGSTIAPGPMKTSSSILTGGISDGGTPSRKWAMITARMPINTLEPIQTNAGEGGV